MVNNKFRSERERCHSTLPPLFKSVHSISSHGATWTTGAPPATFGAVGWIVRVITIGKNLNWGSGVRDYVASDIFRKNPTNDHWPVWSLPLFVSYPYGRVNFEVDFLTILIADSYSSQKSSYINYFSFSKILVGIWPKMQKTGKKQGKFNLPFF